MGRDKGLAAAAAADAASPIDAGEASRRRRRLVGPGRSGRLAPR